MILVTHFCFIDWDGKIEDEKKMEGKKNETKLLIKIILEKDIPKNEFTQRIGYRLSRHIFTALHVYPMAFLYLSS